MRDSTILAVFDGDRAITAPATWAQLATWREIRKAGEHGAFLNIVLRVPVPRKQTIKNIADVVGATVSAHEALRTSYPQTVAGDIEQRVMQHGDISLRTIAENDVPELIDKPFNFAEELPVRFALVANQDGSRELLTVVSHLSVDWTAKNLLRTELLARLEGKPVQPESYRPADRALAEQSAAGQEVNKVAVGRWRRFLDAVEPTNFRSRLRENTRPRWMTMTMRSRSLGMAAEYVADRCRVTVPAVYQTATAVAVAAMSGRHTVVMNNVVSNRFSADERACIGNLSQASAVAITVDRSRFADIAQRSMVAAIRSCSMCHYRAADVAELADAGLFDVSHNDLYSHDTPQRRQDIDWENMESLVELGDPQTSEYQIRRLAVEASHQAGSSEVKLVADRCYLAVPDPARLLRALEALITDAATGGSAPAVDVLGRTLE